MNYTVINIICINQYIVYRNKWYNTYHSWNQCKVFDLRRPWLIQSLCTISFSIFLFHFKVFSSFIPFGCICCWDKVVRFFNVKVTVSINSAILLIKSRVMMKIVYNSKPFPRILWTSLVYPAYPYAIPDGIQTLECTNLLTKYMVR